MTLSQLIVADVAAVFHNTDDFAREITLTRPDGSSPVMTLSQRLSFYDRMARLGIDPLNNATTSGSTSTITAIVELDMEDVAQGNALDDPSGRRVTRMGMLHVAADLEITTDDRGEVCDTVTFDDETWQCIRVASRDSGMKQIVIRRDEKITTKQGRTRP